MPRGGLIEPAVEAVLVGRRRTDPDIRSAAIGDLIAPRQWLLHFGTGASAGIGFGDLGKVTLRVRRAKP